jgi:hypothetical protein
VIEFEFNKVWFDEVNDRIQRRRIVPGIWAEPEIQARDIREQVDAQYRAVMQKIAVDKYGDYRMQQHYGVGLAEAIKPVNKKKEIDHSSAWTALCIWEWLLTYEKEYPGYESYREGNGVMETRDRVLEIAIALDQVWEEFHKLTDDVYDGAFDFEFVPMFLKLCTNAGDKNQDFNRDGHELSVAFPDTEEGIKGAAKLLEKHWLEDGVW